MVDMCYVDSSNIESIGYDPESSQLYVCFLSTGTYVYGDVPELLHADLMRAPSKGSYFNRMIKPVYNCQKL